MKRLHKWEQEEIAQKFKAIADEYDVSLLSLYRIIDTMVNPLSSAAFHIPEEERKKNYLPDDMMKFLLSVQNIESYRPCDLRDLILEKFPNSGIESKRIYRTCQYLVRKDYWRAKIDIWNEEHYERRMEITRNNTEKKRVLYQEFLKRQKEMKANG